MTYLSRAVFGRAGGGEEAGLSASRRCASANAHGNRTFTRGNIGDKVAVVQGEIHMGVSTDLTGVSKKPSNLYIVFLIGVQSQHHLRIKIQEGDVIIPNNFDKIGAVGAPLIVSRLSKSDYVDVERSTGRRLTVNPAML